MDCKNTNKAFGNGIPENLYPNESTIMAKETMKQFYLKASRVSEFEFDYKLWKKLRQMEEYNVHTEFRLFVQILEQKLFRDCYPENTDQIGENQIDTY